MAISLSREQQAQSTRTEPGSVARRTRLILTTLVILLAVGLRFWAIDWGFPYLYDPDEDDFVRPALLMLAERNPNPGYFQHPGSTTIYMLAASYAAIFAGGYVLGTYEGPEAFEAMLNQDPSLVFLVGRIEIALFSVASILVVYMIGRRIANHYVGLMAALVAAISPLHVWISHLIRTDIMMGFFLLVGFWFCLRIIETGSWRHYILAGIFTGLAVVTKYPAAVFVLTIVMAYLFAWRKFPGTRQFLKLVGAGIATIAAMFIASPFLFLDWQETLRDIMFEMRTEHLSSNGEGFLGNLIWYIRDPLARDFTVPGMLIVAFGYVACLASRDRARILLCSFPTALVIFISFHSLQQERWVVAALPFIALIFALGIYELARLLTLRVNQRVAGLVAAGLAALAVVPMLLNVTAQGIAFAEPQSRTVARDWMIEHIPEGTRVLMESYTPQLPKHYYEFYRVTDSGVEWHDPEITRGDTIRPGGVMGLLDDPAEISAHNIEYVVLGWFYERYLREADTYPEIVANYERVISEGELVFEAQPNPNHPHAFAVRIYRWNAS